MTVEQVTRPQVERAALDEACVDTIRALAMDAVEAARSGHPGLPLAMAPVAYVLFAELLRHAPTDPGWPDRDRFVLSAGHGSALLYAALHLSGYDLPLDELRRFRQWGSLTPGHPERGLTPGVETTTGPLGQGIGNAVGMAIAEAFLRDRYGAARCDHRVYVLCSDGDLMEGVSAEAASLAGHLGLGRLIVIYDDNGITIDGSTELAFSTEDVTGRFRAYGWEVLSVGDANDLDAVRSALRFAAAHDDRPTLVRVRSTIGWPAPTKAGTAAAHGAPLGPQEARRTRELLGRAPDDEFAVPPAVRERFRDVVDRGEALAAGWREALATWRIEDPGPAAEWERAWQGIAEPGLADAAPAFDPAAEPAIATRTAGGRALAAFAEFLPTMIGGSADLASSTKAVLPGGDAATFARGRPGRTIAWGVREHAMGAAVNGLALHGGIVRPFGATFLVFSDYMRPAIRLSALMRLPVAWVFTHDSVGVGEDGPTHQPVEHLSSLRGIPGLTVFRPADAAETVEAWRVTIESLGGPVALLLSRQDLPVLDRAALAPATGLARGGYVLLDRPSAAITLVASGSEVALALEASALLEEEGLGARVVSMPSLELFAAQPAEHRDAVLPPGIPSVAVEAGSAQSWWPIVSACVSIERFGASAPGDQVAANLGLTATSIVAAARDVLAAAG